MKKFIAVLSVIFAIPFAFSLTEDEEYYVQNLIANIDGVKAPQIHDDFIVFTADKKSRFTGIAFDFEDYKVVHSFLRYTYYDIDLQPEDSILFYVCKIPDKTREISYRVVIDGIWTTDPVNPDKYYDYEADTYLSRITITDPVKNKTETIRPNKNAATSSEKNFTRFVYQGPSGQKIRLGGNFTNWDSYIYEMQETEEGFYELSLYLPPGTYYYAFYKGTSSFIDKTNPKKAYTQDGRIASVIEIH